MIGTDQPRFLDEAELCDRLGIDPVELDEVHRWGLIRPYRDDRVELWKQAMHDYPGALLPEDYAAAQVGLDVAELRRHMDVFGSARTRFDPSRFWKHRLEDLYTRHLNPRKGYASLVGSHRDFAAAVGLELAPCVVCAVKAVSTICVSCRRPVDPAHCEMIDDDRPSPFLPAQVCYRCLRDKGLDRFALMRDTRSVRAAIADTTFSPP